MTQTAESRVDSCLVIRGRQSCHAVYDMIQNTYQTSMFASLPFINAACSKLRVVQQHVKHADADQLPRYTLDIQGPLFPETLVKLLHRVSSQTRSFHGRFWNVALSQGLDEVYESFTSKTQPGEHQTVTQGFCSTPIASGNWDNGVFQFTPY